MTDIMYASEAEGRKPRTIRRHQREGTKRRTNMLGSKAEKGQIMHKKGGVKKQVTTPRTKTRR